MYARASAPRDVAVAATERTTAPARPPSSGCAKATSGSRRRTPRASRSTVAKNGEIVASAWTVEQTSWW